MNQILDNLRAEVEQGSVSCGGVKLIDMHKVRTLINKAESKWEKDCCEWKPMKCLEFQLSDCVTSCGHAEHYSTGIDKYCRHCGKPIKFSEVE